MPPKKKILIFCAPFSGHLNVLKDLIKHFRSDFDFKLVVTGWENIAIPLEDLDIETTVLGESKLTDTDPALWTLPRVSELLESCLKLTKDFKPDLIVYDFFSLEGYFVGKLLNIPYWCSIPALIGPFNHKEYLLQKLSHKANQSALQLLKSQFGISVDVAKIEMISDGLHVPGEINLLWSYQSIGPQNFKINRSDDPYIFLGNLNETRITSVKTKSNRPKIYFSLGTVVMNNLWNQQQETKSKLTLFIKNLAELWEDRPWDIIFTTQGKQVLDSFPENWKVHETVDQVKTLSKSDVFVTHGGGNSFHEAILTKTPMVAMPFFGDQLLVAQMVEDLGIGISLANDTEIDTHKSKEFLNEALVKRVDQAVVNILKNSKYKQAFTSLPLAHTSIKPLLNGIIHFEEGDLLFGTNKAREKYVRITNSQEEFKILEFKAFSELISKENALPRIVDIYHDVILSEEYFKTDTNSSLKPYIKVLKTYKKHLAGETDFCKMCIKGLDFFAKRYKIHFILDEYDPRINYITTKEVEHVLNHKEKFIDSVIFYKKASTAWIPVDYETVANLIDI